MVINDSQVMDRNEWADGFVDCVVKRSWKDSVLSTPVVLLALFIPLAISIVIVSYQYFIHSDIFDRRALELGVVMVMVVECGIASFILFTITRRSRNHLARDLDWMDSLIGYVESHGRDASDLRAIRKRASRGAWNARYAISAGIWILNVVYIVGIVLYIRLGADLYSDPVMELLLLSYIMLMVQYVFTFGSTTGFPYRHDSLQCEFVREFRARADSFGLYVDPLEPSVPKSHPIVRAVLFVVTIGLFSIPLLLWCNHQMNKHIRTQWKFESDLVVSMIRFEGGIGIEGVGYNQPGNWLGRVLNNLI